MKLYAVIPTHNRPAELAELLESIPPEVHVLVIDNASEPSINGEAGLKGDEFDRFLGRRIQVNRDEEQPPNLSRLWNIGLDWAGHQHHYVTGCTGYVDGGCRSVHGSDYAVAVLNDDVVLPRGFFTRMADELVDHNVDIAFPSVRRQAQCRVNRVKGPPGVAYRMTGWCFVVRGSSGLRADDRLRWWCGDDDIEQQALQGGRGTVRVPFPPVGRGAIVHRHPDQSTAANPVLQEQTHKDMATFVQKWGFRPW